ncbi:GpE family phage tail protein [Gammaproteobacteria bacterium AS21]
MADIAMVLHLSINEMNDMCLPELGDWRERARKRNQADTP